MVYRWWGGGNSNGNFVNASNQFVGVKFLNTLGDTLYGYVEVSNDVSSFPGFFKIHSYGYNSIPNLPVIAGNGGITTSINNLSQNKEVQIFPTIVDDYLSIKTSNDYRNNYTISIINSIGQTVLKFNSRNSNNYSLDLSILRKGVYSMFIHRGTISVSRKFIKL